MSNELDGSLLFKKLDDRDRELISKVVEKFRNQIDDIFELFWDYTDHGFEHCKRVLKALEVLVIGKERMKSAKWDGDKLYFDEECYLTRDEIVLLILGVILHDIGMSPSLKVKGRDERSKKLLSLNRRAGEILEGMSKEYKAIIRKLRGGEGKREELWKRLREIEDRENPELKELRERIRDLHHEISEAFVLSCEELKDILEEYGFGWAVGYLAHIVRGHREDIAKLFNDLRPRRTSIRTPLLAFLLQIADELDIGFERAEDLMKRRHLVGVESLKHCLAHMWTVGKREGGEVVFTVRVTDDFKGDLQREVLRLLVEWNGKIEKKIERGKLYGGEFLRGWRGVLPAKITFWVESTEYEFDLSKRFEVDRELFAKALSRDLYENLWWYAIRELFSNAFDAIKRRKAVDKDFGNPKITVDVELDGDGYVITIEDNGVGMSRDEVEDYLLTVGRSFYREMREERGDELIKEIAPSGYYGIGFLSSFMLAMDDYGNFAGWIEVETKGWDGKDAVSVEIIDPNLPVIVKRSNKKRAGTKIRIRGKRSDVREFFEKVLEKAKIGEIWFPFYKIIFRSFFNIETEYYGIINSILKNVEIPIEVKVNWIEVWNDVIKPIVGDEMILEVYADDGKVKLEVYLIPDEESDFLAHVNGIWCKLTNPHFLLLETSTIDEKSLISVLRIDSEKIKFTNLRKDEVELPPEIVGELFRNLDKELKRNNKYLNVIITDDADIKEIFFENVNALNFIKESVKFKDVYDEFVCLKEIEDDDKIPVKIDIPFFDKWGELFEDLWESMRVHPLTTYIDLNCPYVSEMLFETCKECRICIFSEKISDLEFQRNVKIKNKEFKQILFEIFNNILYIDPYWLVDSPFIKAMCELWKTTNRSVVKSNLKYFKRKLMKKS